LTAPVRMGEYGGIHALFYIHSYAIKSDFLNYKVCIINLL